MPSSPQEKEVSDKYDTNDDVVTIIPSIIVHKLGTSQQLIDFGKIDKSNQEQFKKMRKKEPNFLRQIKLDTVVDIRKYVI